MRPSRRQLLATVVALATLVMGAAAPVGAAEKHGPTPVGTDALARDSWIVTLRADAAPARIAGILARDVGGETGAVYRHALNGFQFLGSAEAAAALANDPRVVSVLPDRALYLTAETLPFGIERIAAYGLGEDVGAYQEGYRGNGARVAILDTGIDLDHPDLAANIDQDLGKNCLNTALPPNDGYGHGTHVAGTVAAPLNAVGVVGVAPEARLVAVKMFDDVGNSSEALALCAFDHVIGLNTDDDPGNDVDVMNMSWGEDRNWGGCEDDPLRDVVCQANDLGIIQVAGSGNSAANAGTFVPAAYPEVISVSAIADFDGQPGGAAGCGFVPDIFWFECDDTFAIFSNHGPVDVAAPGVAIHSTWAAGGYQNSSGTSMATPHVTGVMALMAAASVDLSPADALAALLATGECPNGTAADSDATPGCGGQGTWTDDPDGTPEPMAHALRAVEAVASDPPPVHLPSAPSLSGANDADSVNLSWTVPANDGGSPITGYEVYRGTTSGSLTSYATLGDVLEYADTGATPGVTYWYQVAAVNSAGAGARSNKISATVPVPPPDPPSAPTLTATAGNGSVTLNWTVPDDTGGAPITGYRIYRRIGAGSATVLTTVGNVLTFTNTGLVNGTTYSYQVAAVNAAGAGTPSNEASASPATVPTAPRNVTLGHARFFLRLTWAAPSSDGGAPITSWIVQRTGGSGPATFTVPANRFNFTDTTVARHTAYTYTVRAVNSAGQGPPSSPVSLTSR
jgi:fibronectin type 3 domain-containing protein